MRFSNKLVQKLRDIGFVKTHEPSTHHELQGRRLFAVSEGYKHGEGNSKINLRHGSLYKKSFVGKVDGNKSFNKRNVKIHRREGKKRSSDRWWRQKDDDIEAIWARQRDSLRNADGTLDEEDTDSAIFEERVSLLVNDLSWVPVETIERKPFRSAYKMISSMPSHLNLLLIQDNGHTRIQGFREFLLKKQDGAVILSPGLNYPEVKEFKKVTFPYFHIDSNKLDEYRNFYNRWSLATDHLLHVKTSVREAFVKEMCETIIHDSRPKWARALNFIDPKYWTFIGHVPEQTGRN